MHKSNYMNLDDFIFNKQIYTYLLILKITPRTYGYECIKYGVKLICELGKKIDFNKVIIPRISKQVHLSNRLVDHSICNAIETSKMRKGLVDMERYANQKFDTPDPSPKELLCLLAELVKLKKSSFLQEYLSDTCTIENPIPRYIEFIKDRLALKKQKI